jgi:hypothetical protein
VKDRGKWNFLVTNPDKHGRPGQKLAADADFVTQADMEIKKEGIYL